ncbi:phosphopantetheine-binding protein [Actinacidiphila sp. bgisy145]|uniref:phosphopantetheine-binding protein n=1 Tax=Actinacidiphila sp. bgisy145 TaxID=3413792 RepID=UPI003EB6A08B
MILLDDLDELDPQDNLDDAWGSVSYRGTDSLIDIGLNSLMLARLVIQLASELGIDPFSEGTATLADSRTVDELVTVYERALHSRAEQAA